MSLSNEADFLAVFFLGYVQAELSRVFANGRLLEFANWEQHPLEQVWPDAKQDVRLIFTGINAAEQLQLAFLADQTSIVAGRDIGSADTIGIIEEFAELDSVVAHHARIRRSAPSVLIDKVVDDAAKFGLQIECVKRNPQSARHAPSIFGVRGAAAPLFVVGSSIEHRQQRRVLSLAIERAGGDALLTVPHEHTDDFVSSAQ
jgi:hypothetical protein